MSDDIMKKLKAPTPRLPAYDLGSFALPPKSTAERISAVCDEIRDMLLEKNKRYGNSALEPLRVFSRANAMEQILVRIDDKLSRIRTSGTEGPDEDTTLDLIGYLVLLRVKKLEGEK